MDQIRFSMQTCPDLWAISGTSHIGSKVERIVELGAINDLTDMS